MPTGLGLGLGLGLLQQGGAGGFNPLTSFSGLRLWVDVSDPATLYQSAGGAPATLDTDRVGRWQDKSGLGNHGVRAVAASKGTLRIIAGVRSVRFDGVDDNLDCGPAVLGATDHATIIRAFRIVTLPGVSTFQLSGITTANGWAYTGVYRNGASSLRSYAFMGGNGAAAGIDVAYAYATGTVYRQALRGVSGGLIKQSVNGVQVGTDTQTQRAATSNYYIGGFTPYYCPWDWHEELVYNRYLSDSELAQVDAYLAAKWG